jgi:hypothetical protein
MEAEPPEADPPKRKRRWYQFSLRTLLIFMLVCAVPCAWLGRKLERKRREREIVRKIEARHGRALYDRKQIGDRWPTSEPSGPAWARTILGDDFFDEIFLVDWSESDVTDADLAILTHLPHLEHLYLSKTSISDAGLANLKSLTELKNLYLWQTKVTDAGVKQFKCEFPNCAIWQ